MSNALLMTGLPWRRGSRPTTSEHTGPLVQRLRTPLVVAAHAALTALAVAVAMVLRFDGDIPADSLSPVLRWLPCLVLLQLAWLVALGALLP